MSTVKKDFVAPVVVLLAICIVISAALAGTNFITDPIIKETARKNAEAARIEMLPEADGFTLIEGASNDIVTEAYKANNGVGYVFMMSAKGYGGTMNLICSIDADGKIVNCKTLSHAETKGLGSKTTEPEFRSQFVGKDSSLEGVDTISGSTVSSKAYISAINAAFEVFSQVKEVG